MKKKILYVGLDVHKKSIDVAITDQGVSGKVRSYGKIDGTLEALDKLARKLKAPGADLHFVYEAGPCGYPIYRHLTSKAIAVQWWHLLLFQNEVATELKPTGAMRSIWCVCFVPESLPASMCQPQKTRPYGIFFAAVLTLDE